MTQYLYNNSKKHYTFDFSKKRVKENGSVMSKFSMATPLSTPATTTKACQSPVMRALGATRRLKQLFSNIWKRNNSAM